MSLRNAKLKFRQIYNVENGKLVIMIRNKTAARNINSNPKVEPELTNYSDASPVILST